MDIETAIEKLTFEWNPELRDGFFVQLRQGYFSEEGFERVKEIMTTVQVPDGSTINRRFVELMWFIPTFMNWQLAGWVTSDTVKQLEAATQFAENWMMEILGVP